MVCIWVHTVDATCSRCIGRLLFGGRDIGVAATNHCTLVDWIIPRRSGCMGRFPGIVTATTAVLRFTLSANIFQVVSKNFHRAEERQYPSYQ
jgi:hypothetical protein